MEGDNHDEHGELNISVRTLSLKPGLAITVIGNYVQH